MNENIVVGASALGHLFLRADGSEIFEDAFAANVILISSDLIFFEFGNIMWKYTQFAKLEHSQANNGLNWLHEMISHSFNLSTYAHQILRLSKETSLSYYDASYLFLAQQQNARLVLANSEFERKFVLLSVAKDGKLFRGKVLFEELYTLLRVLGVGKQCTNKICTHKKFFRSNY